MTEYTNGKSRWKVKRDMNRWWRVIRIRGKSTTNFTYLDGMWLDEYSAQEWLRVRAEKKGWVKI